MRFIILLGFLSVTSSSPDGVGVHHEEYHPTPYHYEYKVHDDKEHLDFGAEEKGDGSGSVHGSYHVKLPDGRLQHVSYTVDDHSGYVARVSYDGQAVHPPIAAYGHRHRSGKSEGNIPSVGFVGASFPVEHKTLRSGKSEGFLSGSGSSFRIEVDKPAREQFSSRSSENVFESVFGASEDEPSNLPSGQTANILSDPAETLFQFTPFSLAAEQPSGQIFREFDDFKLNSESQQLVGQDFLFPLQARFQNRPPIQLGARQPEVKRTVITGRSGFRSGGRPIREPDDQQLEDLENNKEV